jgi:P-type Cu+ transporter
LLKDTICGMTVDEATALHAERDGETFYFCSEHCRKQFLAETKPAKRGESSCCHNKSGTDSDSDTHHDDSQHGHENGAVTPSAAAQYFCPMCPGVESDKPGNCPKCGMALERNPTLIADKAESAELHDMTNRFWIGAALTLPVFLLAMAHLIPALANPSWADSHASRWMQFALTTPVVWWAGWTFFRRGWRSVVTRHLNMFTLIAIGVGAAFFFSAVAMLMPGLFPETMQHDGKVAIYFEAASVIVVLLLLGQVLELRARSRTGSAIKALLNLAPPTARQVVPGGAIMKYRSTR